MRQLFFSEKLIVKSETCRGDASHHDSMIYRSLRERQTKGSKATFPTLFTILPEAKSRSAVHLRVGPLPKRTQRQRSFGGFARKAYLPEAK